MSPVLQGVQCIAHSPVCAVDGEARSTLENVAKAAGQAPEAVLVKWNVQRGLPCVISDVQHVADADTFFSWKLNEEHEKVRGFCACRLICQCAECFVVSLPRASPRTWYACLWLTRSSMRARSVAVCVWLNEPSGDQRITSACELAQRCRACGWRAFRTALSVWTRAVDAGLAGCWHALRKAGVGDICGP